MGDTVTAAILAHVRYIEGQATPPPPGKGNTLERGGVQTRLGRLPSGEWYVEASYGVEESYDSDHGSVTCTPWCRRKGQPHAHCHRRAATLAGLAAAATVPHMLRPVAADLTTAAG